MAQVAGSGTTPATGTSETVSVLLRAFQNPPADVICEKADDDGERPDAFAMKTQNDELGVKQPPRPGAVPMLRVSPAAQ